MSSGSVSSLTNPEMNGHSGEEPAHSTPLRTQTSPAATLYPDPSRVPNALLQIQPPVSPAVLRANKFKAGMRKVFTRGPNQMGEDALDDEGVGNAGRRKRMPSLNILSKVPRRPAYRFRIPVKRRRSRPLAALDGIDGHVYEEGYNSDPEGMIDEFIEEISEEDSGEGGMSAEDSQQQRQDLEEKLRQLREAELMVQRLEEESKSKDDHSPDVTSPEAEGKQASRSLSRIQPTPRHSKRNSLELWRKKRDRLSSQLKTHSAHPHHRFMSNTRRHLGSGFVKISKGLKKLRRPKSANGEDDEDSSLRIESASVEDIHQHSSVIDEEFDEDEDEDMDGLQEQLSTLQKRNKELEVASLKHENAMTDLQSELAMLTKVLEGEKEKANNLQISFLEVMELKQHEVNNLQQQLSTVEKQTFDRHQYLEEQVDECNSKIHQLERALHDIHPGSPLDQVPVSSPLTRRFLISVISIALLVFTTVLAFVGYLTKGANWVWQSVFRGSRFLALLSIVLAPIASYLLYLAVHSTTDYG